VAWWGYAWQLPQTVLPLGPIRPTIPTTSLRSMMESQFACQTARPATLGASCVIVSLRRFGTPATTARCRTSSQTAANPVCSHADFVTAPPDPAVRKTRSDVGRRIAINDNDGAARVSQCGQIKEIKRMRDRPCCEAGVDQRVLREKR